MQREPTDESLDDRLDRLVGEYSDQLAAGASPDPGHFLRAVPPGARPGLERCLKMIDAGIASVPGTLVPLAPGQRFGRYKLVREVGRGGMALVWLARDDELQRPVALKVLRPGLALEEKHVDRFRREALAIAKLRHPHIVQIYDVGQEGGYHYLAMEFVEGPSLATVLEALPDPHGWSSEDLARAVGIPALGQRGRSFEQAVAALLAPVAEALHAAHEHGLVHRDVKPSNILLRRDGSAVVADFGLAKGEGDAALSLTGDPIGTPFYMSPEQAWLSDAQVDHRTDVYSLGVTLYEALAGARPFEGGSVLEVFEKIKSTVPRSVRGHEPRVSKDGQAVVQRAMAQQASRRYATALELHEDLERLQEGRTTDARRDLGNLLQRGWTQARFAFSGYPQEYRSSRTFLGLPLVHVYSGYRRPGQPVRVAKGWLAAGDVAVGGLACGGVAFGGLAFGGIAAGLLTFAGVAVGVLASMGGISIGGLAFGGLAAGGITFGGVSLGYLAIGGFARGVFAGGGNAAGRVVLAKDGEPGPTDEEFFRQALPFLFDG